MNYNLTTEDKEYLKTYNPGDYERPSVTVDVLIFTVDLKGYLELLLITRKNSPYKGCLAIPGGFVNMDESIEDAAARELYEETGISGLHMEQLYTFGALGRDPRMRVISVAYFALVPKEQLKVRAGDDAREAGFVRILTDEMRPDTKAGLAFDHDDIIRLAVERLQGKLSYTDIAFNLLKDKSRFTIFELQKINEAILGRELDTANFRRSFIINYIKKGLARETGESCKEFSNRASKYYTLTEL